MSPPEQPSAPLRLHIGGMSCAACVRRVERILTRIDGVSSATVNLATEEAMIEGIDLKDKVDELLNALKSSGYEGRAIDVNVSKSHSQANETPNTKENESDELRSLRKRIAWSLLFSVPLFLLSMVPMLVPSMMEAMMTWQSMRTWNLIALVLCVPVQFWIGYPFYRSGIKSLVAGSPDMNTLVLLGTNAAFLYSVVATFVPHWLPADSQHVYYESSAVVITLILVGKYLELRARGEATRAMQSLLQLQPNIATVLRNNQWIEVEVSQVNVGEIIEIKPGSSVPLDSAVEAGGSFVDESMLTGEPIPVAKHPGDVVIGGTINGNGILQCKVSNSAASSTLARIIELVRAAQSSKPKIQSLADSVVNYFVPVVILIAIATFFIWWWLADSGFEAGMIHAAAVMIIACPCAMGLAVPISIMVASGTAAKHGVLFRNGQAIQSLATINVIALDKTGTVTEGKPRLHEIEHIREIANEKRNDHTAKQWDLDLLKMLSELQASSEHPLAIAILDAARLHGVSSENRLRNVRVYPGLGISGELPDGRLIYAGSERFLKEKNSDISVPNILRERWQSIGASWFYVACDQQLIALVSVTDGIKATARESIQYFSSKRITSLLISGDHRSACEFVGVQIGIERKNIYAECSPASKAEIIEGKKKLGDKVAFVGDGINDSLALSCADVGVAIGTGTDLAIESADIVLMGGDLATLCDALDIAKATMQNIKQNLAWAFGYNILLIPLATGLFKPYFGISLTPMLGALAMSLSSVFVVTNALRLRHVRLAQSKQ